MPQKQNGSEQSGWAALQDVLMVRRELSVVVPEQSACMEKNEVSDGLYQSLSAISIESLVSVSGLLCASG